jgi:hypothetical protein
LNSIKRKLFSCADDIFYVVTGFCDRVWYATALM